MSKTAFVTTLSAGLHSLPAGLWADIYKPLASNLIKFPIEIQRDRYSCAGELQTYSGIAPVTERSGKRKWVHFRWACPKFLPSAITQNRPIVIT